MNVKEIMFKIINDLPVNNVYINKVSNSFKDIDYILITEKAPIMQSLALNNQGWKSEKRELQIYIYDNDPIKLEETTNVIYDFFRNTPRIEKDDLAFYAIMPSSPYFINELSNSIMCNIISLSFRVTLKNNI